MHTVEFTQFASEVLALYLYPSRRKSTRAKVTQVMGELGKLCPTTADLTPSAISVWLAEHPDRSAATHRSLLSTLRAACSYGAFQGWLVSPFAFRPLGEWLPADELAEADTEPFRRHRTAEEVRKVLDQADQEATTWKGRRLRLLLYAYAFTGASKNEILGLRIIDVDLAAGFILIRSHPKRRLKTGARVARLPIPPFLVRILAAWIAELEQLASDRGVECLWVVPHQELSGPWFHGRPGHRPLDHIKALGRRAGVPGLTILSLRHTVGTLAEGWGIGELMLQRLLRHARRQTQQHYRHEDLDQLRRAAELVRYE